MGAYFRARASVRLVFYTGTTRSSGDQRPSISEKRPPSSVQASQVQSTVHWDCSSIANLARARPTEERSVTCRVTASSVATEVTSNPARGRNPDTCLVGSAPSAKSKPMQRERQGWWRLSTASSSGDNTPRRTARHTTTASTRNPILPNTLSGVPSLQPPNHHHQLY
jgi:hypothetical protein